MISIEKVINIITYALNNDLNIKTDRRIDRVDLNFSNEYGSFEFTIYANRIWSHFETHGDSEDIADKYETFKHYENITKLLNNK
jgi:hypothetical protein